MNRRMSLLEAFEYSKVNGCEVIHSGGHKAKYHLSTRDFRWLNESSQLVNINDHTTQGTWERCQPQYTFAKALEMMLKETWMRPVGGAAGHCYCMKNGRWFKTWSERITQDCCVVHDCDRAFTFSELTKPWIEVEVPF